MSPAEMTKRKNRLLCVIAFHAHYQTDTVAIVKEVCGLDFIPFTGDFSSSGDSLAIGHIRSLVSEDLITLSSGSAARLDRITLTLAGLKRVAEIKRSRWKKALHSIQRFFRALAEPSSRITVRL